jgi:CubicO group peptidase (beta-lactamase class C family)
VIHVAGEKVCEWGEPHRADLTFSIAKTYLAMLTGVAHDKGLLPDVHEPVHRRVKGIGFEDAHNAQVTWLHLLQQTSEWEGHCFGIPDQVDRYRHLQYQPTPPVGKKGDARPLQTPGTYWEYNDVRINQLSLALLYLFRRPLPEVFRETIADPCGVSHNWKWEGYHNSWVEIDGQRMQSVPGGTHWGGGISISSTDQALIGQMLLNGGRVGNRQVLSQAWVRIMHTPCDIANWYGMLVWLNTQRCICKDASESSYFLIGAGASFVWINPEFDMVAVVRWIEGAHFNGFCKRVSQALAR